MTSLIHKPGTEGIWLHYYDQQPRVLPVIVSGFLPEKQVYVATVAMDEKTIVNEVYIPQDEFEPIPETL